MKSRFNTGDNVSWSGRGEACCKAYRIGYKAYNFIDKVVTETKYNEEENEWWYLISGEDNWFNEEALILRYSITYNYLIL